MEFKKYNSIRNTYDKKFIEKIQWEGFDKQEWTVSEKLHGANLSLWCNGKDVKIARRGGFLEEGEKFYNLKNLQDELIEKTKKLKSTSYPEAEFIVIYGELIGGNYPHPDVRKNPQATKIQSGVWYSPDNHFYAYDVMLDGKYLDFIKALELLLDNGFSIVPPWGTEYTMQEAIDVDINQPTSIPDNYDLPEIKNNLCEGVVIKPRYACFLKSHERVILKKKNESFQEKQKAKKRKELKKKLLPEEKEILDTWLQYINEQRYHNIVSKIGEVTKKDFGKIMGLFGKDAYQEFQEQNLKMILDFNNLDSSTQKKMKKIINKELANIVRQGLITGELQ